MNDQPAKIRKCPDCHDVEMENLWDVWVCNNCGLNIDIPPKYRERIIKE